MQAPAPKKIQIDSIEIEEIKILLKSLLNNKGENVEKEYAEFIKELDNTDNQNLKIKIY